MNTGWGQWVMQPWTWSRKAGCEHALKILLNSIDLLGYSVNYSTWTNCKIVDPFERNYWVPRRRLRLSECRLSQTSVSTSLVILLALVIRLHLLMRHGAVNSAEVAFNPFPSFSASTTQPLSAPQCPSFSADPVKHLPTSRMHLLLLSTLAHAHFVDAPATWESVLALHALADGGAHQATHGVLQACPLYSFSPYFFWIDVLILSSSYLSPMLIYPVT